MQRIVKLVAMLGGVRESDLVRIVGLTQPTLWRTVERLRLADAIRVEPRYRDGVAGRRTGWLQPMGSTALLDAQRAQRRETAALITA